VARPPAASLGLAPQPVLNAPYYVFHPRHALHHHLFVGYPVAFPYGFFAAYGFGYPYSAYNGPPYDPYASPGAYDAIPAYGLTPGPPITTTQTSGVSFDITPTSAAVIVDGVYVGTVGDFRPTTPPLALSPGKHHLDLRAEGYRTVSFDVTVTPGQVIPYQGALVAIR
jgi:hypothetical protein